MDVKDILRRQPPKTLYHYTSQSGLLGIVNAKEIWASHTQYLNDQREFRHAIEIVRDVLFNMNLVPPHQAHRDLLAEMEQGLKGIESINVCVCSFSEAGDVLSQWRAYGGGSGFSIGFSGPFLRSVADLQEFWLVPCLYDEMEQRELVSSLLEEVLNENVAHRRAAQDGQRDQPPGGNLVAYLNRYAPILKHKSFAEEREWRIVSRPLFCSHERFGYRAGLSMLIPYFRIPLASDQHPLQIEEIVVGPTPHPEQAAQSINGLITRHDLRHVRVRNSETPYRIW